MHGKISHFLIPPAMALILISMIGRVPAVAQTDTLPGRWGEFRPRAGEVELSDEQRRQIERLRALGYVSGSRKTRDSGVTVHQRDLAGDGFNLYNSGHGPEAILIDMKGDVLHRWRLPYGDIWPDDNRSEKGTGADWWRRLHLYKNGDLLAIFAGYGLIKINASSELIWAKRITAHHDLDVTPDGDIYLLTREAHMIPRIDQEEPISEDFISILDESGNEKRRFSVLEALEKSEFADVWHASRKREGDVFHTNSLEVLDGRTADRLPLFQKGNLLISSRVLDIIAVVDPEEEVVVWLHQGSYMNQHDPRILESGNLLLFDNSGLGEDSRVMEFDPVDMSQVWEYCGSDDEPFFTRFCGTAERLPNGNTLITESDNGRVFEVTAAGKIVWEFYNPHRAGEGGRFIACIAEMIRLPADYPLSWARGERKE